ncbi:MAG TPA: 3'-5' exonuclease, partial [Candidatus Paceibacterota bacterium]
MTFINVKNLKEAPIAMTDLETSGDVFGVHEILEVGLVVFDQNSFEIIDTLNIKTKPLRIANAVPAALERNGYNEKDWENAIDLEKAIKIYAEKTKGAIFCAYNATFDWGFMNNAFRETGIKDEMDYHRLDVLSIAWAKGMKESEKWNLKVACEMFGVAPEPDPHNALNG